MIDFITFQSFYTKEDAIEILEILNENGIEYRIEIPKALLDSTLAGDDLEKRVFLKIKSSDFPKANEILNDHILQNISNLESDYYLFDFTNKELYEIIQKPDEWSRQDFFVAKKILEDRGEKISELNMNLLKSSRMKELAREEAGSSAWLVLGYVLAILGGIMGLFIGLPYLISKKILPDGNRVFVYNKNTRKHGRIISIISTIVIVVNLFLNENLIYAFIGFFGVTF